MARPIILKLPTRGHGGQRASTVQDLLVQGIILQSVWSDVVHILAGCDNLVAQLLHVVELIAEQLEGLLIGICRGCYGCQSEVRGRLALKTGNNGVRYWVAVLDGVEKCAAPFPDHRHFFDACFQELFRKSRICRLAARRSCSGTRQSQRDLRSVKVKRAVRESRQRLDVDIGSAIYLSNRGIARLTADRERSVLLRRLRRRQA